MSTKTLTPVKVPAERVGLNLTNQFWIWLGLFVCIGIPFGFLVILNQGRFGESLAVSWFMLGGSIVSYVVTSVLLERTLRYPARGSSLVSIPLSLLPLLILIAILALGRIYYSRPYLICFGSLTVIWMFVWYQVQRRPSVRALAVIPLGELELLDSIKNIRFIRLRKPVLPQGNLDGVVVDMHAELSGEWIKFLADLVMQQKRIYHVASLVESMAGLVSLKHVAALHLDNLRPSPWFNPLKRGMDLLIAATALILLFPVGLAVAALIRLESKGPVIYRQERVGFEGSTFTLLKFRSMRSDAEASGAQFTTENDPRITRMGRFIRKTRLDELPQLWNILVGEMSLVGPRPERPKFVKEYAESIPHYDLRHTVRPGLTGWAQIETGYSSDLDGTIRKVERDFYYIKYRSIALDSFIIYRTMRTVVFGSGAR
ncbi:MAG: hypothetical protein CBC35_00640 [Planctomycetes bacterium TMED75]|nr:glycosyl transferase [Planctomycetaceae bacterium]OUU96769.1 MAG: hypothetical protein CBC35_00640 [Planctomycetes bacterium TMED75]